MHQESLKNLQKSTSLTAGVAAATNGDVVSSTALRLLMSDVMQGTLSARCVFLAQSTSITLSALWEVSRDGTTWVQARGVSNATPVAIATGTGGADVAVTRQVDAPASVYSHRYVRCSVLVGGANGASGDEAAISYDYVQDPGL